MNLTYTMQGDYRLPNLSPPEAPRIGKYGMLRRSFLRNHMEALYTGMLLTGTLNSHLEQIDRNANQMMEQLTSQMQQAEGVTERLKASNQMEWVQRMSSIRMRAEEVVLRELIYL